MSTVGTALNTVICQAHISLMQLNAINSGNLWLQELTGVCKEMWCTRPKNRCRRNGSNGLQLAGATCDCYQCV